MRKYTPPTRARAARALRGRRRQGGCKARAIGDTSLCCRHRAEGCLQTNAGGSLCRLLEPFRARRAPRRHDFTLRPIEQLMPKHVPRDKVEIVVERAQLRQGSLLNRVDKRRGNIGVGDFPRSGRRRGFFVKPFAPIERERLPSLKQMHDRPLRPKLRRIERATHENGARDVMHRLEVESSVRPGRGRRAVRATDGPSS